MSVEMNEKGNNDPIPAEMTTSVKRFLPAVIVAALFVLAWMAGWFDYFSISSLIRNREYLAEFAASNPFVALGAYVALYAGLVAISFPGASLVTTAAGFVFGGVTGAISTVFGATIGAVAIFLVARSSAGDFLVRRAGPFVGRMVDGFNKNSFNYLLIIRLTPLFPFWAVNIVPALLNMQLLPYTVATAIGIIPGTFAYSFVGSGLGDVIAAQEAANPGCAAAGTCGIDPANLINPQIVWAMLALAAISTLPIFIRRFRDSKSGGNS